MPLLPVSELERLSPLFKGRAGNALASILRKLLSIERLSDYHDELAGNHGPDFAGALIERLGVKLDVSGADRLLDLPEGPFITVSNHPYGGMDGIILLDLIGHRREDFKVMVNEFLSVIEPLRPSWIVVNPKNNSSDGVTRKNIQGVRQVLSRLRDGHPVGFFPSGAVSDFKFKEGRPSDREWQEPMIKLIQKARVPIVPVRFFDRNSAFFYFLGLIDWRIRVLRLPRELVNKKGSRIRVGIGKTISVEEQSLHPGTAAFGAWLRDSVYGMTFQGSDK
ncbi:MAG: 1-acyl-sn-glycerol-3-phosphate acyltransferase [Bacteroidales bacterium]|nr:1-acyl-sn-glycerol-3-phosphate acyltransferase [Bacteroidales bacterium]